MRHRPHTRTHTFASCHPPCRSASRSRTARTTPPGPRASWCSRGSGACVRRWCLLRPEQSDLMLGRPLQSQPSMMPTPGKQEPRRLRRHGHGHEHLRRRRAQVHAGTYLPTYLPTCLLPRPSLDRGCFRHMALYANGAGALNQSCSIPAGPPFLGPDQLLPVVVLQQLGELPHRPKLRPNERVRLKSLCVVFHRHCLPLGIADAAHIHSPTPQPVLQHGHLRLLREWRSCLPACVRCLGRAPVGDWHVRITNG